MFQLIKLINYDCGSNPENFDEKIYEFCLNDQTKNLQGSHWAPHLIHRELWNKVKDLVKNLILVMDQI